MRIASIIVFLSTFYSSDLIAQSWDELAYLGKKYHHDGEIEKAIEFLSKGADKKGQDNQELYLHAGILAARIGDVDKSFALLERAVDSGMWDIPRLKRNSRLTSLRQDARWQALISRTVLTENKYVKESGISHPVIREELKSMWTNDQNLAGKENQSQVIYYNSQKLDSIVDEYGWPTRSMVGKDGAWFAWAIAQHALDIELQKKWLSHIKRLLDAGEIAPEYYAELNDRIARNSGKGQTYERCALCGSRGNDR